jgi:tetratricopeptide (TPR) repeat protein
VPRALETLAGILAGDPTLTLETLLADGALFSERVVENLVSAHHRQLGDGPRHVLEALAVYDQPVPAAAVRYLLQPAHPEVNVEACLRDLTRHQFVTHHRGRSTYELHPLDQQYAYAHLPDDETRRTLHRRAAGFHAEMRKPKHEWKGLADLQPQLAEFDHLVRAGDADQACALLQGIDFEFLARWGQSELVVTLRERLVGRVQDAFQVGMNYYNLGLAHNRLWSADAAIRCFESLLQVERNFVLRPLYGDRAVSDVRGNLARSLLMVGRIEEALGLFEETVAAMRQHGHGLGAGLWTGRRGEALERLGRLTEAKECQEFALAQAREAGYTRWEVTHLSNLAEVHRLLGDTVAATRLLLDGLSVAERTDNAQGRGFCLMRLGLVHHEAGRRDEAASYYEQAVRIGLPPCNFLGAVRLGMLREGDEARPYFAQGMALCRTLLTKTPRLYEALYALALAQLGDDREEEALATYRQAVAVCAAPGVREAARRDVRLLYLARPGLGRADRVGSLLS